MKKLLSLTAAALLLITTGCGRSNAPPASASSGTPSVSAPITEPTVESSDDTTPTVQKDEAAVKPQSSRRLDDSRIIPLYSERFTYTDPNGIEDTYFYEVPQIDDDTEDAKHINEMIDYRYGYLVERALDARSRNDFIDTNFIIWVSNWTGPVLTLQVTSSDTMYNHDVGSYHYNFATGQELTNLDLLEYMGYTDGAKTLNALQRATAQHFDLYYGGDDLTYAAMLKKMRVQSLSELDSVFTYYSIFPHFSNGFVVTVPMYTPAGSGMYWTDVQVDPNKRQASGQVLHGQDEWFTCDVTATGKVTVRALTDYVSSDGAVTYQDMKEWYELGDQTEFTVNGCYGNYVKMLMTSVGQDYAPYVFLLTEDGNVEDIRPILVVDSVAAAAGGFMGVSSITTFVESTSGAADGGRTGLTSVTTGVLFILAAFFSPIVTIVSSAATCGALVYVGYLMMSEASEIDWSDVSQGFPAFMIVAGVPFTYSISAGIGLGFIAYVIVALFKGEASKIKPLMWIAALAFLVYFFVA